MKGSSKKCRKRSGRGRVPSHWWRILPKKEPSGDLTQGNRSSIRGTEAQETRPKHLHRVFLPKGTKQPSLPPWKSPCWAGLPLLSLTKPHLRVSSRKDFTCSILVLEHANARVKTVKASKLTLYSPKSHPSITFTLLWPTEHLGTIWVNTSQRKMYTVH